MSRSQKVSFVPEGAPKKEKKADKKKKTDKKRRVSRKAMPHRFYRNIRSIKKLISKGFWRNEEQTEVLKKQATMLKESFISRYKKLFPNSDPYLAYNRI